MTDSVIVRNRLKEICPSYKLKDKTIDEVESDVRVAYRIIGYIPKDFSKSLEKAWETSEAEYLWEFVYDIWRMDS